MSLNDKLVEKKGVILESWKKLILETYPGESSKIMKSQRNRFANPIGYSVGHGAEEILTELLGENRVEEQSKYLDEIIRIRAVQEFSASAAAIFIFLLKDAVRMALGKELNSPEMIGEYLMFESKIDKLALKSFDIYMDCRERVNKNKADENRRLYKNMFHRVNKIFGEKYNLEIAEDNNTDKQGGSK